MGPPVAATDLGGALARNSSPSAEFHFGTAGATGLFLPGPKAPVAVSGADVQAPPRERNMAHWWGVFPRHAPPASYVQEGCAR